jgi:hypothetical protein
MKRPPCKEGVFCLPNLARPDKKIDLLKIEKTHKFDMGSYLDISIEMAKRVFNGGIIVL